MRIMLRNLAFWLALALCTQGAWFTMSPAAFAQDAEEQFEEESEEAEVDEGEEEEADDEEADEELGELHYIKSRLKRRLKKQQAAVQATERRIQAIDDTLDAADQVAKLERNIERAEERRDEQQVLRLTAKLERLEHEMEIRGEILELEHESMEIEEQLEEAEDEEEFDRLEILEVVSDGLKKILAINHELLKLDDGEEEKIEKLQVEKAELFTRSLEKGFNALELIEEIFEAEEEEDDERIEELEEKLEELRGEIGGNLAQSETKKANAEPTIQTIVVSEETLAAFAGADIDKTVAPLLRRYCFDCHSNDSSSGELNLEVLLTASPIVKERDRWINVIEQTKNHVMPPEDESQPTTDERKQIVLALHNAIHKFDYSDIKNPGFENTRRLTHREYSNTVRDLFGIEIDVVKRFPDDLTASSGFDNSANSLFIQPLLMERYLSIAEHVVDTALPAKPITDAEQRAHDRIFTTKPKTKRASDVAAASEEVLKVFLARAYRRPPTANELDRFTRQTTRVVEQGESFETAIKATLQAVLITPSFLLLTENDIPNQVAAYPVGDYELASRLSYFLWASMPDDELFDLAGDRKLGDPEVMSRQVVRMLKDLKAKSLGETFASQWLGSQHLGVRMRLDPIDNPWCTETLMAAMREETSLFFNHLVTKNRPITELVNADYTFLNEELAKLYRIKDIKGEQMRLVKLDSKQRGGIFGQGSLLAVTSFPYRTSPVVRGKWILDTVLGTPPPPPPPNVSELSEEVEENERLSFREKLELHREKPNCYACHSEMDPLGFSLEEFDWFGRYRSRMGRRRIDANGKLPNGTEFEGVAGLKKVVVEQRRDDLIRQVVSKLLTYGLGRQLEYYDEPAIRNIVSKVSADGDLFQTAIREVVVSYPFRYKKHQGQSVVLARPVKSSLARIQLNTGKASGSRE